MTVRVLLADDHVLMRRGLANLIEENSPFRVIGEADNGKEVVRLAAEVDPDIIIMDFTMPQLGGVEATREIISSNPAAKIICLSVHTERRFAERMINAGAKGFLRKDCDVQELQAALNAVFEGRYFVSPSILGPHISLRQFVRTALQMDEHAKLSSREQEIIQLIAKGHTTKEIAEIINIGTKSIEKYRQGIMEKLGLDSVAALVRYAIDEGYISE